jgi:glucose-1-phosphate cytidylyltransferase
MKVVLLAGGHGTRLSEETEVRPKPMVSIGGKPILWHIMKIYSSYGLNDFVILLGYKGYLIKEYFANYFLHQSDVTIDLGSNKMEILNNSSEPWKVTLIDTGLNTMTGGRIKKAQSLIGDESFMLTYGDGLANINIANLLKFHNNHEGAISITSAQPDARFGALEIDKKSNKVLSFKEKPKGDGSWINAGYFVCDRKVFDYINSDDQIIFEQDPLNSLARDGEMFTFKHDDFWMPMDTLRDKIKLNMLWDQNQAPWKIWDK